MCSGWAVPAPAMCCPRRAAEGRGFAHPVPVAATRNTSLSVGLGSGLVWEPHQGSVCPPLQALDALSRLAGSPGQRGTQRHPSSH